MAGHGQEHLGPPRCFPKDTRSLTHHTGPGRHPADFREIKTGALIPPPPGPILCEFLQPHNKSSHFPKQARSCFLSR